MVLERDSVANGVTVTGSAADNQIAVFTDADTIEGDANLTWDGTSLTIGTDVALSRSAANELSLASGDTLVLATDGSTGGLKLGASGDVSLFRGAANRLDLAAGDDFRMVDGDLTLAAGVVSITTPVTTDALTIVNASAAASGVSIALASTRAGIQIGSGTSANGERIVIGGPRGAAGATGSASAHAVIVRQVAGTYTYVTTPQTGDVSGWSFDQVTLANPSAGTIAIGATLDVVGPPIAGTNVTLTTPLAIRVRAGNVYFNGELELDGALNHDGTTVGFYGVAPATQAADTGAFTSVGASANHTLVDVATAGIADPAKVNANFDDVADGLNDIRDCLRGVGLMA